MLRISARWHRVAASSALLGQPPLIFAVPFGTLLHAHLLHRFLRLFSPGVELAHILDTITVDLPHSSVEDFVFPPPVFTAFPSSGNSVPLDGLLDAFLYTAVVDVLGLRPSCFFAIGLV